MEARALHPSAWLRCLHDTLLGPGPHVRASRGTLAKAYTAARQGRTVITAKLLVCIRTAPHLPPGTILTLAPAQ